MAERRGTDYEQGGRQEQGGRRQRARRGDYEGQRWAEEAGGRQVEFEEEPRWMGGPYDQSEYPQGGNYGQGYASQGGAYGGRRAGGYQWNGPEYGQQSRYGDEWRGREQGFRGSDRGGQEWRTPDYGWQNQYAGAGGQERSQDFGAQRYGPNYGSRYWGDQDRWYGEGGWGREGSQRSRPFQGGRYEPARMAYDEDYWQDHDPNEYRERHPGWFRGPHAGKGPSGYQRPDSAIHDEACEMLTRHGHIDATEMDVSVKDGVVTLSGNVENRPQKRMAEDLVESISGVKDVNNQLHIGSQAASQGSTGSQQEASSSSRGEGTTAQPGSLQNGKTTTTGRK